MLLSYDHSFGNRFLLTGLIFSFVFSILFNSLVFQKIIRLRWAFGILLHLSLFFFGMTIMNLHRDQPILQSERYNRNNKCYLIIQIISDPVKRKNSYKCIANISWLVENRTAFYESEKMLLYFKNDPLIHQVSAGSWIITRNILQPIENFKSFDFDYRKFCRLRHIYSQLFLKEKNYALIEHHETSVLLILNAFRKKILTIIKQYLPGKSDNGFLEALLVGFTDDLDPGLLKSYADTGVIHIIAISGLHLALICHFLQFVFRQKKENRSGSWIKMLVMITCLWGYSLLSGASPSVIRAAGMFSLAIFAKNLNRGITLYNMLAASAFLLLCYDPYWIFDTGFQLSYAAVLSLGLFSKPVRSLLLPRNKMLSTLWNATSVSIAAQILTIPVSIFYFHRFPTYFLIANLLAVPLSSLILAGGILLCVIYPIQFLATFTGWILGVMIALLNGFIARLAGFPGAVIGNLNISLEGVIMVYLLIFCLYQFILHREKYWLFYVLGISIAFLFFRLIH